MAGRWIFDPQTVHGQPPRREDLPRAELRAMVEGGLARPVAAAVNADAAAGRRWRRARDDVDEGGGPQPILRRQRPGDERRGAGEGCLDKLRKTGNAVRQENAIDAILHIGVFIADVEIAAGGGILRHAGRLQ